MVTLKDGTNTKQIKLQAGDKPGVEIDNVLTEFDYEFVYE